MAPADAWDRELVVRGRFDRSGFLGGVLDLLGGLL